MTEPKKQVLVVDDDPDIVEMVKTVLETNNYVVSGASSKEAALEAVKESVPDLFVIDVMMAKETDGFHLAYELRKNEATSNVPILMLTAVGEKFGFKFSPDEDEDYLPVDVYIEKPVDPQALIDKVNELVS